MKKDITQESRDVKLSIVFSYARIMYIYARRTYINMYLFFRMFIFDTSSGNFSFHIFTPLKEKKIYIENDVQMVRYKMDQNFAY